MAGGESSRRRLLTGVGCVGQARATGSRGRQRLRTRFAAWAPGM